MAGIVIAVGMMLMPCSFAFPHRLGSGLSGVQVALHLAADELQAVQLVEHGDAPIVPLSVRLLAAGHTQDAATLRDQAFDQVPATAGTIDGQEFEWIADADPRTVRIWCASSR